MKAKNIHPFSLGHRIESAMKKKGINQKQLSELIGVSQPTIGRIIRDEHDPGVSIVKQIAFWLDIDLHYLITGVTYQGQKALSVHEPEPGYFAQKITQQDIEFFKEFLLLSESQKQVIFALISTLISAQKKP